MIRCIFLLVIASSLADSRPASARVESLEAWLQRQEAISVQAMLRNISPAGTRQGVVVASPSRHNPDYFYHWVRDAGLTMDVVVDLYASARTTREKRRYYDLLMDFASFSRENQLSTRFAGDLGEPKFFVDGRPYDLPWARPQNDGPAIRALALTRFAKLLIAAGQSAIVRDRLYDPRLPANSVIKTDLEYVAHHWRQTSFDVWEESSGMHFFTLLFQRRSLVLGAELAELLHDAGAAAFYREQAQAMENVIRRHWDAGRGYLLVTLNRDAGIDYKHSGLDSAVLIAALRAENDDGFLPIHDDMFLASAQKIEAAFAETYAINWNYPGLGVAIGRYPEDTYDGYVTNSRGNPWALATCTFAEFHYRLARIYTDSGFIQLTPRNLAFFRGLEAPLRIRAHERIERADPRFAALTQKLRARGDAYLARLRFHTGADGSLSEQMNRDNGYMQGAPDLTWSYAAFLTAVWARQK